MKEYTKYTIEQCEDSFDVQLPEGGLWNCPDFDAAIQLVRDHQEKIGTASKKSAKGRSFVAKVVQSLNS